MPASAQTAAAAVWHPQPISIFYAPTFGTNVGTLSQSASSTHQLWHPRPISIQHHQPTFAPLPAQWEPTLTYFHTNSQSHTSTHFSSRPPTNHTPGLLRPRLLSASTAAVFGHTNSSAQAAAIGPLLKEGFRRPQKRVFSGPWRRPEALSERSASILVTLYLSISHRIHILKPHSVLFVCL